MKQNKKEKNTKNNTWEIIHSCMKQIHNKILQYGYSKFWKIHKWSKEVVVYIYWNQCVLLYLSFYSLVIWILCCQALPASLKVKTVYLHLKRIRTTENHIEICCGSDISGPHGVKKGNLSLKIEWLVSLFTKGMHVVICFMCFFGMLKNTPLLHNCGFRFPTTSTFPSHCQISDSPPCECLMLTLKQWHLDNHFGCSLKMYMEPTKNTNDHQNEYTKNKIMIS